MAAPVSNEALHNYEGSFLWLFDDLSAMNTQQVKVNNLLEIMMNLFEVGRLGMSHSVACFDIRPSRHPEGPARILLQVIDREPEAVMRALNRRCSAETLFNLTHKPLADIGTVLID